MLNFVSSRVQAGERMLDSLKLSALLQILHKVCSGNFVGNLQLPSNLHRYILPTEWRSITRLPLTALVGQAWSPIMCSIGICLTRTLSYGPDINSSTSLRFFPLIFLGLLAPDTAGKCKSWLLPYRCQCWTMQKWSSRS